MNSGVSAPARVMTGAQAAEKSSEGDSGSANLNFSVLLGSDCVEVSGLVSESKSLSERSTF